MSIAKREMLFENSMNSKQSRNFDFNTIHFNKTVHFCLCYVGATHAFRSDLDKGSCGGLVSLRAGAGCRMVHREEPPLAGEYNLSLSATTRKQWEKHHKQQLVSMKLKKCKVYGILNHNYLPLDAHKTDQKVYDLFVNFLFT